MEQAVETKIKFPLWLKVLLSAILAQVTFMAELLLLILLSLSAGALSVCLVLLMFILPLTFGLIWLPKKKRFMLSVCGAIALLIVAAAISFGIYAYDQSLIIDTAPAIPVSEYMPFDENSKIVKIRSEKVSFDEDAPVIDGAAALFPVYSAFVNATYPEDTEFGDNVFQYNNTPEGYRALAEKRTDVFIGVYPSKEQLEYAKQNDTHFTFTPIGYDAFVFFVHKDNPIDNLTSDQIRAIYSGEITNWKELGGNDEDIVAYQRNEGSGSQSMLARFMGDRELMDAPSETVNSMGGIIDVVADYRSVTASIGFSFRFYVEGIIQNPDIKMIAIDGVQPTAENVRSERYPICTPFYAVTYEENENPNTDTLIQWILSDEGQYIIEQTGYIGMGSKKQELK